MKNKCLLISSVIFLSISTLCAYVRIPYKVIKNNEVIDARALQLTLSDIYTRFAFNKRSIDGIDISTASYVSSTSNMISGASITVQNLGVTGGVTLPISFKSSATFQNIGITGAILLPTTFVSSMTAENIILVYQPASNLRSRFTNKTSPEVFVDIDGKTGYIAIQSTNSANASSNFIVYNGNGDRTLDVKGDGAIQIEGYGTGTLQTDASGNITASSDERLKDIQGNFEQGIEILKDIQPIKYKWNEKSGYDTKNTYIGLSAQNVKSKLPEAVGVNKNGSLTLSDRALISLLINTVKKQSKVISELEKRIEKLENK